MAKPEWGMKHECPNCSVRFYDLCKPSPITCISCGYEFATDILHRVRKTKAIETAAEDDIDTTEDDSAEIEVDTSNIMLHDSDDDDDPVVADTSDMTNIDDDMFPDDDDTETADIIPDDLLLDDDSEVDEKKETDPKA